MSNAADIRAGPSRVDPGAVRPASHAARGIAILAIAWTTLVLVTSSLTPSLQDGRLMAITYAFVALQVQTFQFHVGVGVLAVAVLVLVRRATRRLAQEPGRPAPEAARDGPALIRVLVVALAIVLSIAPELRHAWPARGDANVGRPIRVVSLNDAQLATNAEAIAAMVARERPDLVAFQQFSATTDAALSAAIGATYPHRLSFASPPHQGIALYSRWPLQLIRAPSFASDDHGRILEASVDVDGRSVRVFVVHLTSPRTVARVGRNRSEAATLVSRLRESDAPTLVVGDFNAPLGTQTLDAVRSAGLQHVDDRAGWGLRWTWMPVAGVPVTRIDHVFASPHLGAAESSVLGDVGSDHLPILVELRLP